MSGQVISKKDLTDSARKGQQVSDTYDKRFVAIAATDGLVRSFSTACQNLAGKALTSAEGSLIATATIELLRLTTGLSTLALKQTKIQTEFKNLCLMFVWALFAVVMTVLHVYSYEIGADQGIATMIVLGGIIPGALIDRYWFGDPLPTKRIAGMGVFLVAAWSALNFPGKSAVLLLPSWVYFKVIIAGLLAVNEAVRRTLMNVPPERRITTEQSQFWVGAFALTLLMAAALHTQVWTKLAAYQLNFWLGTLGMGTAVVISTALSLQVYKFPGSITTRKLVSNTTVMITSVIVGVTLFGEPFTAGKALAMVLFVAALVIYEGVAPAARQAGLTA